MLQDCYCRLAGTRARTVQYEVQYSTSRACRLAVGDLKRPKRAIPARPRSRLRRSAPAGRWLGRLMAAVLQYEVELRPRGVVTRYCAIPWRPIGWIRVFSPNRAEYTPEYRAIPRNTLMARIPRSARPRPQAA
jgi:hypothetical protein